MSLLLKQSQRQRSFLGFAQKRSIINKGSKHMPKMKSVKGAVKRFKVKKSGKIKRGTAYRSHILTKVDGGHHRSMRSPKYVDGADAKNIKEMIN